jgi:hypothetical protein
MGRERSLAYRRVNMKLCLPLLLLASVGSLAAAPMPGPLQELKENEWYLEHLPGPEPMSDLDLRRMRVWATRKFDVAMLLDGPGMRMPWRSQLDPKTKLHYCDVILVASFRGKDPPNGIFDRELRIRLGGYVGNWNVFGGSWRPAKHADDEPDLAGTIELSVKAGRYDFESLVRVGRIGPHNLVLVVGNDVAAPNRRFTFQQSCGLGMRRHNPWQP